MHSSELYEKKLIREKANRIITIVLVFILLLTNSSYSSVKRELVEPTVSAGSYIVMSGSSSEIVYEEHAERKLPMGAITKYMTAMVVLDNMHDESEFENIVEITDEISNYGEDFETGESVRVEDLLKAMLVGNSNEAAEALARYSASKRSIFISEMNSKAMELELISTQFANPTGKYDIDHYATAVECASLVQAAIRYDKIKEIVALDTASVSIFGNRKKGIKSRSKTFVNTNPLTTNSKISQQYSYTRGGIVGELALPTNLAQYAGVAIKDDMQLIVVILEGKMDTLAQNAIDLFEYGYSKVSKNTIVKAGKCLGRAKVRGGAVTRVKGYTETKGFAYIPPEGSTDLLTTEVFMYDDLEAPLRAGQKIGEFRIYVADELKGTVDLITKKEVKKGWLPSYIYISNFATTLTIVIILLLVLFILRLRAINKRKAMLRRRERQAKIREMALKQEALDEDRRKRNWTYTNNYDNKDLNDKL